MLNQYLSEPVAQLIWTAAMVLAFAGVGAVRTYHSSKENGQQWEWEQGKHEIIALGGAGALAGVYVFTVGGNITDPLFGTAVTVGALMARKAYLIRQDTAKRYNKLSDAGVEPDEAALLAIKYGFEQNDPSEVFDGMTTLLEQGGNPSVEKAQQNVKETREQAEEDGVGSLFPEDEALLQTDDWDDEAGPIPPEADAAASVEGEGSDGDGDGDGDVVAEFESESENGNREESGDGDSEAEARSSALPPA